MMSVEVLAGSPSAVARSEDFIFFDFLSFLESLSLPMLASEVQMEVQREVVRAMGGNFVQFSRSTRVWWKRLDVRELSTLHE